MIRIFYSTCILLLILSLSACRAGEEGGDSEAPEVEMSFDKAKWKVKEGAGYPYRGLMLKDLVSNDTVRELNGSQILELLGEPDRSNENHLYYMIKQRRIVSWPLHTRTLVIKLSGENKIEWMKIHE